MDRHLRRVLAAAAIFLCGLLAPGKAGAQEVIHGADSLYADASVKLAWAVLKGASEDTTTVTIRIVNAAGAYRFLRADGVDPFTKDRVTFAATQALGDRLDLRIQRSRFADHPSLELMFDGSEAALAAGRPKVTIYYLGVPDTTPEFLSTAEAEAYLLKMLGKP